MEITDQLIEQAAEGDLAAFEHIYKEYFRFVASVAGRIVNRHEDAEDVTQEVFIQIFHNLKYFRFQSSLKTWIYRMTVNTSINYAKKIKRHQHAELIPDTMPVFAPNPAHHLDNKVEQELIETLMESIKPDQRACLVLRTVEGLSYQQIAETLNIPLNTVRTKIKRARETMMGLRKKVMKNDL